jgi:hypothetical protein
MVVTGALEGVKLITPGPDSFLQRTLTADPAGRPSSVTLPESVPARIKFGVAPAAMAQQKQLQQIQRLSQQSQQKRSDEAYAAFNAGDYARAYSIALPLAGEGFMEAQTLVGYLFEFGYGTGQSYEEAMYWYRRAADQGSDYGQYRVGVLYDYGSGVPEDDFEAAYWFQQAADKGNLDAQNSLAYMYEVGAGVAQDLAQAVKWYRRAADGGLALVLLVCAIPALDRFAALDGLKGRFNGVHSTAVKGAPALQKVQRRVGHGARDGARPVRRRKQAIP